MAALEENMIHKTSIVIENQYFGTVNWYKMLFQFSNIKIEQYESYQKMSFRNRCVIAGSNGLIHLSVPLEKGRSQNLLMKEVRISYSNNWQEQHWKSIVSCYGKSPFFEFYRDGLFELFQKRYVFLQELNLEMLDWVKKQLKWQGSISLTDSYIPVYGPEFLDYRDRIKPKFFQLVEPVVKYPQVFEDRIGFQPNLSILDLLFCCGPGGKSLLDAPYKF